MKKIKVVVSKDAAHAVSDWDVAQWYQDILATGETAYAATATMFSELRVGVRLGEIQPFEFEYEGEIITLSDTGELSKWPLGLFDHMIIQMDCMMQCISREEAQEEYRKNESEY